MILILTLLLIPIFCRWEESDDESKAKTANAVEAGKATQGSRRVVKVPDTKPVKGRRIRIKRKSPVSAPPKEEERANAPSVETAAESAKPIHTSVKKAEPPAKEVISDARMVITLRRNSKHLEERGRRVSMGNPDESRFEPDYEDSSSPERAVTQEKTRKTVGLMRSVSQDSSHHDDAIALSDYSNFSNEEAEKKKKHKKKKKKKKKHKMRSQVSDLAEEDARKKSQSDEDTASDDHMSGDERRDRRRNDSVGKEKVRKKESKRKHRDVSRGHRRDRSSRNRDERYRDSPERFRDDNVQKKRKKEKRSKHHRRNSSSYLSDGS